MTTFKVITPEEIKTNPFHLIGKEWMLISAEKDGNVNTMTANWGGVGVMWNLDVVFIVVRPQRYTKEFIDKASTFSLTFFDEAFKDKLRYLGTTSGRDEDKISKAGLDIVHDDKTPYFAQAKTVLICEKLFAQPYQKESFIDVEVDKKNYKNEDYHCLYIAKILKVLVAE